MFLILSFLFLVVRIAAGQDPCIMYSGSQGNCINIRQCPSLLNILTKPRPLASSDLDMLRKSQCGFEGADPKVCCEVSVAATTTEQPSEPSVTPSPPSVDNHPNLRLLNNDVCGPITESKIFGGQKTTVFEFPWMTLIAYDIGTGKNEFRCGGSLISKRYVLTAAHCVTSLPSGLRLVGVRVGEHDLSKERDCDKDAEGLDEVCSERYQDFRVERVHSHPGYLREKLQNDIALIRINADADFRPDSVKPVCLPIGPDAILKKPTAIVTGWGATEKGPRSQALLKVSLPLVPNDRCAQAYKSNKINIWYKQLCAGGSNKSDSCAGDSGGPLQAPGLYNNQPRIIQYGVVSFGPRTCGIEDIPGVYTKVLYYLDWILDTLSE